MLKKIIATVFISVCTLGMTKLWAGGVEYIPPPPVYSGFYVEGNFGAAFRDWEEEGRVQIYLTLAQGGFQNGFGEFDNGQGGLLYGFDMGYQWTRLFAAELGWYRLPRMQYSVPQGYVIPADNTMTFRNWLAYIALKFNYPLYERLYVTAKLGAGYVDTRVKNSFIPVQGLPGRGDFWAPLFAFGLQYYFNWNWSISAQYMFVPGFTRVPQDGMIRTVPSPHSNIVTVGVGYKAAL